MTAFQAHPMERLGNFWISSGNFALKFWPFSKSIIRNCRRKTYDDIEAVPEAEKC